MMGRISEIFRTFSASYTQISMSVVKWSAQLWYKHFNDKSIPIIFVTACSFLHVSYIELIRPACGGPWAENFAHSCPKLLV